MVSKEKKAMSREKILNKIVKNKPAGIFNLPDMEFEIPEQNLTQAFFDVLPKISVKSEKVSDYSEISLLIKKYFNGDIRIVNTLNEIAVEGIDPGRLDSIKELHLLDLAIVKGDLAVAENGAIWVSDKNLPHRIIPFICENLILVIDQKNIVNNMHEAYRLIGGLDYNYGVFIAGPSKTADIEQSLVVGAQGPRNLMVVVVERPE